MKKTSLLILLLGIVITLPAQQMLKHEKVRYTAPDGKLYINKDLPVYLFLSVTPDMKDGIQLESEATKAYANPLYLDTDGLNTIRTPSAVDPETRKTVLPERDVVFEVYADGIAPSTASSFTGAPRYTSGGTIYYGKGLTVSLSSKDAVSGVEQTYYSISRESYQKYNAALSMNKEGQQFLQYYAADFTGNAENPNAREFVVDLSAPKTTYATTQPKKQDILSPKATISLSFSDNLAGVRNTNYTFDDGTERRYGSVLSLGWLSDGDHTLYYYSVDNVDNAETRNAYKFYLDKTPPVVSYEIRGDQYQGTYTYVSNRTKINLSATDNKAGVEAILYRIDGGGENTFSQDFAIPDSKGIHNTGYWATDQVTNRAANKNLRVYMDNVAPTTAISYGNPQFFDRDTLFVTSSTRVTLTPRDAESGVKTTAYSIDGAGTNNYNAPFTLANEGNRKISFTTTDNVNNKETEKSSEVYVDNTPPVIYANFSIKSIGKTADGTDVYPNYTRLYIGATDKKVGTGKIQYSMNGAAFVDYSSPYTLDVSELDRFAEQKKYTVVIKAIDKLGNESEKTVMFYVGKE